MRIFLQLLLGALQGDGCLLKDDPGRSAPHHPCLGKAFPEQKCCLSKRGQGGLWWTLSIETALLLWYCDSNPPHDSYHPQSPHFPCYLHPHDDIIIIHQGVTTILMITALECSATEGWSRTIFTSLTAKLDLMLSWSSSP